MYNRLFLLIGIRDLKKAIKSACFISSTLNVLCLSFTAVIDKRLVLQSFQNRLIIIVSSFRSTSSRTTPRSSSAPSSAASPTSTSNAGLVPTASRWSRSSVATQSSPPGWATPWRRWRPCWTRERPTWSRLSFKSDPPIRSSWGRN